MLVISSHSLSVSVALPLSHSFGGPERARARQRMCVGCCSQEFCCWRSDDFFTRGNGIKYLFQNSLLTTRKSHKNSAPHLKTPTVHRHTHTHAHKRRQDRHIHSVTFFNTQYSQAMRHAFDFFFFAQFFPFYNQSECL